VQRACSRTETWNSFQQAVAWGNGGRIATNNPRRREELGLAQAVLMNAITFHTVWRHGDRLRKKRNATPIQWGHVRRYGQYRIGRGRNSEASTTRKAGKTE